MDEAVTRILTEVPELAVLAWLVSKFLASIKQRDELHAAELTRLSEALETHMASDAEVLKDITRQLRRNGEILAGLALRKQGP